jgi:hypothetical protein
MNNEYFYANYNDNPDPSHRPMYLKKTLKYLRCDKDIKSIIDVGCGGGGTCQPRNVSTFFEPVL